MLPLLNLLAAIALLVWGTHIVRTGMLRVFGENLRHVLAASFVNRKLRNIDPMRRWRNFDAFDLALNHVA